MSIAIARPTFCAGEICVCAEYRPHLCLCAARTLLGGTASMLVTRCDAQSGEDKKPVLCPSRPPPPSIPSRRIRLSPAKLLAPWLCTTQTTMSIFDDAAFLEQVDTARKRWALATVCISVCVDADRSATKWFGIPSSGVPDEESIVCIASNTKFFTAVGLAILVEEGKLRWTDRLVDLVRDLQFVDEETAAILTLEDALSHRSGLPSSVLGPDACQRSQLTGSHARRSPEADSSQILTIPDAFELVGGVRPTQPALKVYQYNNACWYLAGHIIAQISGRPYADFIEQRILRPLRMTNSSYGTPARAEKLVSAAVAIPGFGSQDIEHASVGLSRDSISAPGGRLLSTPADMSIWLRYLTRLYNGTLTETDPRIIASSTLKEMLRSRALGGHQIGGVPTKPSESLFKEMSVPTYALGQYRCQYRGLDMIHHWGEAHCG